jgi:UDP-glucose 4-epimerase
MSGSAKAAGSPGGEAKGKQIVVTGGAGFIGSELVRQLVAAGATVTVIDNLVNGRRENLDDLDDVELVVADVRDAAAMAKGVRGADYLFHLACLGVRHSIHSPAENHAVNATATLELLALAQAAKVARFVHVSSSEVYGTARWVPMTEDHPTSPMTVYGAAKLAGECYARAYWQTYRFPTVVIRPFNAFGPRSHHEGDSGEVVPKFMLRAMAGLPPIIFGDGSQTRDLSYVSDTARGIISAGLAAGSIGQTINIGTGRETTINALADEVWSLASNRRPQPHYEHARPGDVLRLRADIGKAQALAGYEPTISLRDGLIALHQWYVSLGKSPETLLREERIHNWER